MNMDAAAILDRLRDLGISVEVADDRLRLAPGSRVPPELVDELKAHKQEIILALKGYQQKYPDSEVTDPELDEIAQRVHTEGYILLWSNTLQDLVAFYRDEEARCKIPPGFVAYGLAELSELFGKGKVCSDKLRLVHEAKRLGGHIVPEGS
jgi:hypothetical protein